MPPRELSPPTPPRPPSRSCPWTSSTRGCGQAASVVSGTEIATFDIEILDVVAGDSAARAPYILVRASGPAVDATGIGPGFSGSPISCPDEAGTMRVAGAISEGIGDYGNKVALATPIELMLGEPVDPPTETRTAPALVRSARPLATPLSVGGLSAPVAEALRIAARRTGAAVYAAPPAPTDTTFGVQTLQGGSAMAVGLATGDVSAGAIGTVTYVDGDRLWAFGHPLDGAGRRRTPLPVPPGRLRLHGHQQPDRRPRPVDLQARGARTRARDAHQRHDLRGRGPPRPAAGEHPADHPRHRPGHRAHHRLTLATGRRERARPPDRVLGGHPGRRAGGQRGGHGSAAGGPDPAERLDVRPHRRAGAATADAVLQPLLRRGLRARWCGGGRRLRGRDLADRRLQLRTGSDHRHRGRPQAAPLAAPGLHAPPAGPRPGAPRPHGHRQGPRPARQRAAADPGDPGARAEVHAAGPAAGAAATGGDGSPEAPPGSAKGPAAIATRERPVFMDPELLLSGQVHRIVRVTK